MIFNYFDFISPRITLYHNNLLNHTSYSSIILSILTIIIIIIFSIIFSLDFVFHKNPTSFYYKRFVDDVGYFPLNSSSLFHFISLLSNGNNIAFDDSLLSVIGVQISEDKIYEYKFNRTQYNHWIYGLCNKNDVNDFIKYFDDEQLLKFKKKLLYKILF